MTLDIGPGHNVQPHRDKPVIRYDMRKQVRAGVVGDARALPFRDNAFSTVYASHVLEHFHWKETRGLLAEWFRVLRVNGELQLFVPNMEWVAFQLLNGIADEFVWNATYGRQEYPLDVHRTGFTPKMLQGMLKEMFPKSNVFMRTFRNSICVWMVK